MGGTGNPTDSVKFASKSPLWARYESPDGGSGPGSVFDGQALPSQAELDVERVGVADGIRRYHSGDLPGALAQLKNHPGNPLARQLATDIAALEERDQKTPLGDLVKALVLDASVLHSYSKEEEGLLLAAAELVGTYFLQGDKRDLRGAIEKAKADWDEKTRASWERFDKNYGPVLSQVNDAFQETNQEILAKNCLWLARDFRGKKLGGSAWLLAQLAAQEPASKSDAEGLKQNLEGRRVSTEYLISDFFDQGGSSIAIHLLALAPTIGFTRKLWRTRPLYALLAGGPIHYLSTKTLLALGGYDGKILPRSFGEFFRGLGTSYLETAGTLLLAHRFYWRAARVAAAAPAEGAEAARKFSAYGAAKMLPKALWWTTKTSLKVGTVTIYDLSAQYLAHVTGVSNMTPKGLPQNLMYLFPDTKNIRREVSQGYKVRSTLIADRREDEQPGKWRLPSDASLETTIDTWLARTDFSGDPKLNEMLFVELYAAAKRNAFNLNIQRWIQRKMETGDYPAVNQTLERQEIPIRVQNNGRFCLLESEQAACGALP